MAEEAGFDRVRDGDYVPIPRGLLWARPVPTEDGGGLELACDCGAITIVVIENADQITGPAEIASTCPGCSSVRWITLYPLGEEAPGG